MKYFYLLACLLAPLSVQAQDIPLSLAGITLGQDISTVHHRCVLSSDMPLSQERHLNEINLKAQFVPGIKSGNVAYANCAQPGKIVRIKLKFDNPERSFFDDLLERYEKQFGKPQEWRGDPFQTVISWKWNFKNDAGQRVNLELTHSQDDDYKTGNFVKMTLRSLWEEEAACIKRNTTTAEQTTNQPTPAEKLDFNTLVPR